jgi:NADPH-dependent 2,4-dienoyl-CoA reductase/sulfur reductase-like enzyme
VAEVDLAIVGAGPAGLAAAVTAAEAGLEVALLDEQPRGGGQIFRAVTASGARHGDILGADYLAGAELVTAVAATKVRHISSTTVWELDRTADGVTLTYSRGGSAAELAARTLILATGALERPVPLPGWTLPGVLTAGAGQILLKVAGVVPARTVLAGTGPLLYLLATQLVRAGRPPLALVDTTGIGDLAAAAPRLPAALRGWRTLAKGLGLLARLRRAGVPHYRAARDLVIEGADQVEAICFASGGRTRRVDCDTVLLHQGVVPDTQASRSLELEHAWDEQQLSFRPVTDAWGESSAAGIFVAGDGAGIAGAAAAEAAGRLSALAAAHQLGAIDRDERDRRAAAPRRKLATERALRPFLDAAYPPPAAILRPADTTIVCRCEEITAGTVRAWARQGAAGPSQLKAFGRCGMGPCQGRYCGLTVTALLAEVHARSPAEIGAFRIRPPLKPVTLGELAALDAPAPTVAETTP